jgi:hypothetical protein
MGTNPNFKTVQEFKLNAAEILDNIISLTESEFHKNKFRLEITLEMQDGKSSTRVLYKD